MWDLLSPDCILTNRILSITGTLRKAGRKPCKLAIKGHTTAAY